MDELKFKKGQRLFGTVKKKYYIVERVSRIKQTIRVRLDEPGKAFFYNIPTWRASMIFVLADGQELAKA